jgi:hypothetical protein
LSNHPDHNWSNNYDAPDRGSFNGINTRPKNDFIRLQKEAEINKLKAQLKLQKIGSSSFFYFKDRIKKLERSLDPIKKESKKSECNLELVRGEAKQSSSSKKEEVDTTPVTKKPIKNEKHLKSYGIDIYPFEVFVILAFIFVIWLLAK